MNRRFWSALLFLLICGTMGSIPFLKAESEDPGAPQDEGSQQSGTTADDQKLDPPLPPLPDTNGSAAVPPSLPWGSSSGSAPPEAQAQTAEAGGNEQENQAGKVLLHRNGRLFHGDILDQGDIYLIQLAHGEVELKKSEVEFVGADVSAVYRYRQSKIEPGSIDRHMELASWCAAQKLLDEAEHELSVAAGLAPQHPKIALIARQIELARREPSESNSQPAQGPAVAASFDAYEELARNLPSGAVASFTEQVQPLLMNSCATSGCHVQGATTSRFEFLRYSPSQGASQRLTQQNLQAALRYVNPNAPERSELLTKAITEHGGSRVPPINSTASARFETLARWVLQATGKSATATNPSALNPDTTNSPAAQSGMPQGSETGQQSPHSLPQQPVVRTADEVRALFGGHSFIERYDRQNPKEETVQFGLMGERPAADFPGLQGPSPQPHAGSAELQPNGQQSTLQGPGDAAVAPNAGPNYPDGPTADNANDTKNLNDMAARAAANGITNEEQMLLDQVSEIPPNRVRVGAGDQQRQNELHHGDLGGFQPRDPFDPAIFNRKYGTRPPQAMLRQTMTPQHATAQPQMQGNGPQHLNGYPTPQQSSVPQNSITQRSNPQHSIPQPPRR